MGQTGGGFVWMPERHGKQERWSPVVENIFLAAVQKEFPGGYVILPCYDKMTPPGSVVILTP